MDFLKDLIATRGTQLVSRYTAKGLLILGTYLHVAPSTDGYSHTGEEIGAFVVAGIFIVIDHFSHAKQAGAK